MASGVEGHGSQAQASWDDPGEMVEMIGGCAPRRCTAAPSLSQGARDAVLPPDGSARTRRTRPGVARTGRSGFTDVGSDLPSWLARTSVRWQAAGSRPAGGGRGLPGTLVPCGGRIVREYAARGAGRAGRTESERASDSAVRSDRASSPQLRLLAMQRAAGNRAVGHLLRTQRGNVPDRAEHEKAFDTTFDDVEVVNGRLPGDAPPDARAVTRGQRIWFADQLPPQAVVAHELAHVVQQRPTAGPDHAARGEPSTPDPPPDEDAGQAEHEADRVAVLHQQGRPARPQHHRPVGTAAWHRDHVRRMRARGEAPGPPLEYPALAAREIDAAALGDSADRVETVLATYDSKGELNFSGRGWSARIIESEAGPLEMSLRYEDDRLTLTGTWRVVPTMGELPGVAGESNHEISYRTPLAAPSPEEVPGEEPEAPEVPPERLPTSPTASAQEMARIGEARSEWDVTRTRTAPVEYLDPSVTTRLPVQSGGGVRRRIFGRLARVLRRRMQLPEQVAEKREQLEAIEERIAERTEAGRGTRWLEHRRDRMRSQLDALEEEQRGIDARVEEEVGTARQRLLEHLGTRESVRERKVARAQRRRERHQSVVDRLESRLRTVLVESVQIQIRLAELDAEEGTAEPDAGQLDELRADLEALTSELSEEERAALLEPPSEDQSPRQLRRRLRQLRRRLAPLLRARDRLGRARRAEEEARAELEELREVIRELPDRELTRTFDVEWFEGRFEEEGRSQRLRLRPSRPGINVDRPGGFMAGGSTPIPEEVYRRVTPRVFTDIEDPEQRAETTERAEQIMATWSHNEGRSDSLNTWDRVRLTLGPGIAAAGVLQRVFLILWQRDPEAFDQLFGRYGIGIHANRRGRNPRLSVVVPEPDPENPPPAGTAAPGTRLTGSDAIDWIIQDPVLLLQLRRAGRHPSMQEAMVEAVAGYSVRAAVDFELRLPPDQEAGRPATRIAWRDLMLGHADQRIEDTQYTGTLGAIADDKHGHGTNRRAQRAAREAYVAACQAEGVDPTAPNDAAHPLSRAGRERVARAVLALVSQGRRSAFEEEIGEGLFEGVP